ncbi:MAG: tetratricopeptide repeat protein [Phycisphaerales bacterium]|nr:MAG: tetratricopeptide repeat protein [Phycisphaerales bacterium]
MAEGAVADINKTERTQVKHLPAVGPRLRRLLFLVFALFALLAINAVYLSSITAMEWAAGQVYQNYFYQYMFLMHLVLGLLIIVPVIVFGLSHMANARHRLNRRAVRAGYALFSTALLLLASGLVLTRLDLIAFQINVKNPQVRGIAYWVHVITPLAAVWLFVLHRLAGRRIKWRVGGTWGAVATAFAAVMVSLQSQDPRRWDMVGPESSERYFFPSLARTTTGSFIPAEALLNDKYCLDCHADVHASWGRSMHRFSSFNNPAYGFSVLNTRAVLFARDGNMQGSRFCAGCHDPVPFFSGAFDDPKFDDPEYDLSSDALAQAGITCSVCHSINTLNSVRGNADYTIDEPAHYPFAFSKSGFLRWVNKQLVKAKPAFHKKTFLKPHHKTAEFCGTCHKVHLPPELNEYKWLRGQNHYDSYLLSGVSGHGVSSFYYPPKAEHDCNGCHMPLAGSNDFGAKDFDGSGTLKIHDHQFPSANTAIPHLLDFPKWVNQRHGEFLEGIMRVDLFAVKRGATIDGPLTAPIRPSVPALEPSERYLLEIVIRTVKMGHVFTEGTADSNEVWLDVTVTSGDRIIGRSGGCNPETGEVDPWAHFVNAYVIDRHGNRIDRRNAEDIFIALYNNQIPPGGAAVAHYALQIPESVSQPITVDIRLLYRKFDTLYMQFFQGENFKSNDLPITTLASDRVIFPITGVGETVQNQDSSIELWQRWNDYGIGLLRKGDAGPNRGELRQAEAAFTEVEKLGRPDGPLNRARVYYKEGRLDDAVKALQLASSHDPPAPPWVIAWFSGLVNKQNGYLDEAIADLKSIINMDTAETRRREFDFSQDYRLLNELGQTVFERSKQERGDANKSTRQRLQREAAEWFEKALALDPENTTAHHNLGLVYAQLGEAGRSKKHRNQHAKYKPDDNARDAAIAAARRRSAPANHAAEAIVIYDLQRLGAYELDIDGLEIASRD